MSLSFLITSDVTPSSPSLCAKLYTNDFVQLERELHKRYKKYRIPQTEYFRLKDNHLREIKQLIYKLDYPMSVILRLFIKSLFLMRGLGILAKSENSLTKFSIC